METLAVVAFRQPVVRAEIEAIRGVGCGEILNQLMNRDLIRVGGRSDELGRPYLYNTTKRFLQVFGLRSLSDLPQMNLFGTTTENSPPTVPGSVSEVHEQDKPTNDLGG
jgi:segregation and condensation protein B